MNLRKFLAVDARNERFFATFAIESYWKKSQQFIGTTSNYDND